MKYRTDDKKEAVTVNIGGLFSTLLAVAFIVLKLCHIIEWSWIWVLAPLWIPLALGLAIVAMIYLLVILAGRG